MSDATARIHETPRYRPARFGGPSEEPLKLAKGFVPSEQPDLRFRPPEEVAEMVLRALRKDRAVVVTDSTRRDHFVQSFVDVVLSAFDDAAAFDANRG